MRTCRLGKEASALHQHLAMPRFQDDQSIEAVARSDTDFIEVVHLIELKSVRPADWDQASSDAAAAL